MLVEARPRHALPFRAPGGQRRGVDLGVGEGRVVAQVVGEEGQEEAEDGGDGLLVVMSSID